jgi:mono/diheme cytochrome c family protein
VFVGTFATADDLLAATRAAREQDLRIADAYTPYPVHGLDEAMRLPSSRLPWACFVFGLIGVAFAVSSQPWAMAESWPMNVGGKPWNSLPAFIPITFELMVLFGGLGVVLTFLLRCRLLPGKKARPLFQGATDDAFVLVLEYPENPGGEGAVRKLFTDFHAVRVAESGEPGASATGGESEPMSWRWLNFFLLLALLVTVGLHVFASRDFTQGNIEAMPEMVYSPAYDSFAPNPNFPDGKTLQLPQPGTIPRGRLPLHYGPSFEDFLRAGDELHNPVGLPRTGASTVGLLGSPFGQGPNLAAAALMPGRANSFAAADVRVQKRGAFVFKNYCQTCHGSEGKGDGPMVKPMVERGISPPASLTADKAKQMKDGELFHILTYGQRNMPSQEAQLSREDRWKVILHLRWLQQKQKPAGEKRP